MTPITPMSPQAAIEYMKAYDISAPYDEKQFRLVLASVVLWCMDEIEDYFKQHPRRYYEGAKKISIMHEDTSAQVFSVKTCRDMITKISNEIAR